MTKNINWNKYAYNEEQLREAIVNNTSCRRALLSLGLYGEGSNYRTVKRIIKILNLDTSHWTGRGHLKGKSHSYVKAIPLKDVLVKDSHYSIGRLKSRLVSEGILKYECALCFISNWNEKALSLHLDHINGINDDNTLENLRLLCPNCHSQTDTYTGRNIKKAKQLKQRKCRVKKTPKINKCSDCSKDISLKSLRCKSCTAKQRNQLKIDWPSLQELKILVSSFSYLEVGRRLGVSDNAVRKRIRALEFIDMPHRKNIRA